MAVRFSSGSGGRGIIPHIRGVMGKGGRGVGSTYIVRDGSHRWSWVVVLGRACRFVGNLGNRSQSFAVILADVGLADARNFLLAGLMGRPTTTFHSQPDQSPS